MGGDHFCDESVMESGCREEEHVSVGDNGGE